MQEFFGAYQLPSECATSSKNDLFRHKFWTSLRSEILKGKPDINITPLPNMIGCFQKKLCLEKQYISIFHRDRKFRHLVIPQMMWDIPERIRIVRQRFLARNGKEYQQLYRNQQQMHMHIRPQLGLQLSFFNFLDQIHGITMHIFFELIKFKF